MTKPFAFVTKQGRVVRSAVLESYATKSAESKQLQEDAETWGAVMGRHGLREPLYPPGQLAYLLELNTYHYRCVTTKARESAGLGWSLKPVEGKDEETADQDQKERARRFFEELSDPIVNTLNLAMVDYESIGYAAMEVTTDEDGAPVDVIHMPATTMRAHRDKVRFEHRRGTKGVWYKSIREGEGVFSAQTGETAEEYEERTGEKLPFAETANDLLWFRNYTPDSDYYGKPDVMPALGAIHGDLSRRDYNISFFDNYGVPSLAVFITGDFDPGPEIPGTEEKDEGGNPIPGTGRTALEDTLEGLFADLPENPHSSIVLTLPTRDTDRENAGVEVEFKPLSTDVKDASFRLYRKDNRDEVIHAHGVPGYRIGINEEGSLGGSTARESTEIYKRSILEPRQTMLEDEINTYLLQRGLGVTDWEWKLDEIDARDETADLNRDTQLFDRAALTPNELRERAGLKRIEHPAMDLCYLSGKPINSEDPVPSEGPLSSGEQDGDVDPLAEEPQVGSSNGDGVGSVLSGDLFAGLETSLMSVAHKWDGDETRRVLKEVVLEALAEKEASKRGLFG